MSHIQPDRFQSSEESSPHEVKKTIKKDKTTKKEKKDKKTAKKDKTKKDDEDDDADHDHNPLRGGKKNDDDDDDDNEGNDLFGELEGLDALGGAKNTENPKKRPATSSKGTKGGSQKKPAKRSFGDDADKACDFFVPRYDTNFTIKTSGDG